MPSLNQKGAVVLVLFLSFAVVAIVAGVLVFKTISQTSKQAEVLSVALESEYNNPFDKQYVNPFGQKNPFDDLK